MGRRLPRLGVQAMGTYEELVARGVELDELAVESGESGEEESDVDEGDAPVRTLSLSFSLLYYFCFCDLILQENLPPPPLSSLPCGFCVEWNAALAPNMGFLSEILRSPRYILNCSICFKAARKTLSGGLACIDGEHSAGGGQR